jgi:hypothetical protein
VLWPCEKFHRPKCQMWWPYKAPSKVLGAPYAAWNDLWGRCSEAVSMKVLRLEYVIKVSQNNSLTFRIPVKKKVEMNNKTHFQALINAAIW